MRRPGAGIAAGVAAGAAAGVAVLVLALALAPAPWGASGPVAGASAPARGAGSPAAGLEQSWTTGAGTWAVVAMGRLDQHTNTFWQVLFRPAGATRWTLVTPPGVASNGGLALDGSPGASTAGGGDGVVTAGFEPTSDLTYSPIAQTSDDGKTWTAGTLPSGLLAAADAVAGGAGGEVLAIERAGGGTLVRSDRSLTRWKKVVSRRALDATPAGRSCGVEALTALADPTGAVGSPELGAACATPGIVGLFHETSGRWASTDVRLAGEGHATASVLRLESGPSGTSALLELRRAAAASLVALWRSGPTGTWAASAPVALLGSVVSTASAGGTSLLVVTGKGLRGERLLSSAGPGTAWRSLGRLPAGTAVVAPAPGASASGSPAGPGIVALAVSGSDLTVFQRAAPAASRWRSTTQWLRVPIQYGSST